MQLRSGREIIFINRVAERWWRIFEYLFSKIRRMVEERFRNSRGPFRGLEISRERAWKTHHEGTKFPTSCWEDSTKSTRKIWKIFHENGRRREKPFFKGKNNFEFWNEYWKNLYSRTRERSRRRKYTVLWVGINLKRR